MLWVFLNHIFATSFRKLLKWHMLTQPTGCRCWSVLVAGVQIQHGDTSQPDQMLWGFLTGNRAGLDCVCVQRSFHGGLTWACRWLWWNSLEVCFLVSIVVLWDAWTRDNCRVLLVGILLRLAGLQLLPPLQSAEIPKDTVTLEFNQFQMQRTSAVNRYFSLWSLEIECWVEGWKHALMWALRDDNN